MVSLFALLIFVAIGGCSDGDRRTVSDQPRSVPQPSAATLENCRAMYPTQPELEQACIRRWTVGEAMPGPSTPPLQSDAEKVSGPHAVVFWSRWYPSCESGKPSYDACTTPKTDGLCRRRFAAINRFRATSACPLNARILLANPQVPKFVCPTCLLGRQKSWENFPKKKYS